MSSNAPNTQQPKTTTKIREFLLRYVGVVQVAFVLVSVSAYLLGGRTIGKQTLGICLMVGALLQQFIGKIPYGWEGAAPSGYWTGWKALLANLVLAAGGAYVVFTADSNV